MDSKSSNSSSSSSTTDHSDHSSSGYIDSPAGRIKTYDDEFMMYNFKVYPCCIIERHDWQKCKFYHSGEAMKRRDPRKYDYSSLQCPKFRNAGSCDKGDYCEFAHGLFETWLHPDQYKTKLCKQGQLCDRDVCFFAHGAQELRQVCEDFGFGERRSPIRLSSAAEPFTPYGVGFLGSQDSPFTLPGSSCTHERNVGITVRDLILRQDLVPGQPRLVDDVSNSWQFGKLNANVGTESNLSRLNAHYASDFSPYLFQHAQGYHSHSQRQLPYTVGQSSRSQSQPQPQSSLLFSNLNQHQVLLNQSSTNRAASLMDQSSQSQLPSSPLILNRSSQLLHQISLPPSPENTNLNARTFGTFSQFQRSNQELNQSSERSQPSSLVKQSSQPDQSPLQLHQNS